MTNPASLEGKTIIVTGAAQGIGKALCEQALAMGANVAAVDINEAALSESFGGKDRVLMVPGVSAASMAC